MIKLLSHGEKTLDTGYATHSAARAIRRLRLGAVFASTVSMILAGTSVGQFAAFPQQKAVDAIVLFVSSAVCYLYALGSVAFSSDEQLSHFQLEEDGSSIMAARRRRTRRALMLHFAVTAMLAAFVFASWVYAAYRDSQGTESCKTYWSPTPSEYSLWNETACRLMTASTIFAALTNVVFVSLAVALYRQARRVA